MMLESSLPRTREPIIVRRFFNVSPDARIRGRDDWGKSLPSEERDRYVFWSLSPG